MNSVTCIALLVPIFQISFCEKETVNNNWLSSDYAVYTINGTGSIWEFKANFFTTTTKDAYSDYLLVTPCVDGSGKAFNVIYAQIEAEISACGGATCPDPQFFEVYLYQGQESLKLTDDGKRFFMDEFKKNFNSVYNITGTTRENHVFNFTIKNNPKCFQLGVRTRGSSGKVYNIELYYFYCKKTVIEGIEVERTISPATGRKKIEGNCTRNSLWSNSTEKPNLLCSSEGEWLINNKSSAKCSCKSGHEEISDSGCEECKIGYFKPDVSNVNCSPCPLKSNSFDSKTSCRCNGGFYNLTQHPSPCYALLKMNGKPNVNYSVDHRRFNITWKAANQTVPNDTVHYDIKILICSNLDDITSSCKENGETKYNETKTYVVFPAEDVKYLFRVYPKNSLNNVVDESKWDYSQETFDNSLEPTLDTKSDESYTKYIIIGAVAFCTIILIIILIIVCCRMSKGKKKKPTDEAFANFGMSNVRDGQNYIDPNTYEDPEEAVLQFTSELEKSVVRVETLIGGGEFGDVYKGVLDKGDDGEIPVAIKTLKTSAGEKDNKDFLLEASMLGQFKNTNIVRLEGVVTKSLPRMIVLEFVPNGSLDNYLKSNKGLVTSLQLIGMARGVGGGMEYLAGIHFVHRDLAARNILVDERLLCKIADFGLSRELENTDTSRGEYATTGGKIPVRWTAPEAIAVRTFSSASDVWSYGILLWEIFSFAERPYGDWDNFKVMDSINEGYRLPAPESCPKGAHDLMLACWQYKRSDRPTFFEINAAVDKWIRSPETMNHAPNLAVALEKWLRSIKMEIYLELFREKGYNTLPDIYEITNAKLEEMGIRPVGHRHKIVKQLELLEQRAVCHHHANDLC